MAYTLDVEHFIGEVEKYPCLWDINCEEYRYRQRKQQAWGKIARIFIQDVEDMNEVEQEDVCKKLFGKWRNIRDSYVRNLKKVDGRKYTYAKNLAFLDKVYCNNTKTPTTDHDQDSDDDKPLAFTQPKIEIESWSEDENSTESKRRKKTVEFELNPLLHVPEPNCSFPDRIQEDEDRSFFDSLLPAVRAFDMDQKIEFRFEVLNLVKRLRSAKK